MANFLELSRPGDGREFDLATRVAGLESDYEIADALGVHRSTVGRVLADELRPGPVFIAGALSAFKTMSFTDLFEVVEDRRPRPADDALRGN